jgi:biotin-dependent carboxylase-like uncharacterized protein
VNAVRVLEPGLLTLIQDLGRPGREHWGVAPSGAFDRAAHARAQRLVGNPETAAGLEVLVGGLTCVADGDLIAAVTGASCPIEVGGREESGEVALYVRSGTELRLRTALAGVRAYVAVRGGLGVRPVQGSRSRDTGGGLGPPALSAGDVLPVTNEVVGQPRYEPAPGSPIAGDDVELELALGPHDDLLDDDAWHALERAPWVVGERSDRMGVRLAPGPGSRMAERLVDVPGGLPSFPVLVGSVQLTPSGELLVLGPDAGVTGGYPVLGVVARSGLDAVAQCRTGSVVRVRRARTKKGQSPGQGRGSP